VVIPVFNGERFLAEALRSILAQTLPPDEIIVVDDGSTDGSAALAAQFARVLVLRQSNRGAGAALNLGTRHARGDLLAFLDADDRWLPGKLAAQVAILDADATVDMVFGHVRQFRYVEGEGETVLNSEPQVGIICCAMLIRRAAFDRAGAFSEDPGLPEFIEWYARARAVGLRAVILPEVVYERRIHAHNSGGGRSQEALRRSYLRVLRQSLAQRRAEEADTP
jgi:glycosyltransferase involved in cell wall biosynthesis